MSQPSKLSPYRWIIEVLLLLLLTAQSFAWLAPAPILQEIKNGLGISLSSAGLIISIIALCIGIFSLLGAVVAERIGALRALMIGIWLMAIGQVASGYAPNFAALLACRVLEGVGYGLVIAPPGTLVMQWFGEGEWPYINMVNFAFGYVGLTARVPRDAGAVRRGRVVADDSAVVRRRIGGRRAAVDALRPRASGRNSVPPPRRARSKRRPSAGRR